MKRGQLWKFIGYIDNIINAGVTSFVTLIWPYREFYKEACNETAVCKDNIPVTDKILFKEVDFLHFSQKFWNNQYLLRGKNIYKSYIGSVDTKVDEVLHNPHIT